MRGSDERTHTIRRVLATISVSALLAAACTGQVPPGETTSPTEATAEPSATETPTANGTAAPSPSLSPSPSPSGDAAEVGTVAWVDRAFGEDEQQGTQLVVADVPDGEPREVQSGALTGIAWSPSGDRIAYIGRPDSPDGPIAEQLVVVELRTGDATVVATGNFSAPEWSPDGRRLVVTNTEPGEPDPNNVAVVDVETSAVTAVTEPAEDADDMHPTWSPNGERIAFVRTGRAEPTSDDPSDMRLLTVRLDGSDQREFAPELFAEDAPDWAPDGATIALPAATTPDVEAPRQVHLVAADGGSVEQLDVDGAREGIAFSPDGRHLAVPVGDAPDTSDIHVVDVASGSTTTVLDGAALDISPTWAPGGGHLAFLAATGLEGEADVALGEVDSGEVRLLTEDGSVESPAFAPR